MIKRVARWVRKWWWAVLAAGAVVVTVLWRALTSNEAHVALSTNTMFAEAAKTQVERVRLEGEIEKARASAKSEQRNVEIDEIERVGETDPVEARRLVSSWLARNL